MLPQPCRGCATSCSKHWRTEASSVCSISSRRQPQCCISSSVQFVLHVNHQVSVVLNYLHFLSQDGDSRSFQVLLKSTIISFVLFVFKKRWLFPHWATKWSSSYSSSCPSLTPPTAKRNKCVTRVSAVIISPCCLLAELMRSHKNNNSPSATLLIFVLLTYL